MGRQPHRSNPAARMRYFRMDAYLVLQCGFREVIGSAFMSGG
jgi:hypothetical protein